MLFRSEALDALNRAAERDPALHGVLFNLGVLYYAADQFGDLDRLGRLKKSQEYFAAYKQGMGYKMKAGDESDKYLKELTVLIERETVRIERMKEAEKQEAERLAREQAAAEATATAGESGNADAPSTPAEGEAGWEDEGWE